MWTSFVSLSVCHGCLLYGARVVIPHKLRHQVLDLLHECHFGIQRMKQLARTAIYWPNIDSDILDICRQYSTCAGHESEPSKASVHPWMLPEKPWSRLHIDHAINFLGYNWPVVTDAYTEYPCIHATQSVSAKPTIKLLQGDFAHFGFPHTVVTDCAATFKSDEFQEFYKENGIVHLTGAPYHPATNGAAERLVQTFKQALKKSDKATRDALQDFLRNYRRTPLSTGYSPSKLLNGRQIRTKIDTLLPSPAHTAQGRQAKSQQSERQLPVTQVAVTYEVGDPCYVLYFGPRRDRDPRWVTAIVVKRFGTRSVDVRVVPRGPVWRRHIDQLQRRYVSPDDTEPGDTPRLSESREENHPVSEQLSSDTSTATTGQPPTSKTLARNMDRAILGDQNGRENLVNFFVVKLTNFLPHRGGVISVKSGIFSKFPWRKFATIPTALIAALFLPANDLFQAAR